MAMRINWFGPTCLRAHCRIHDIRAVLDEHKLWGETTVLDSMIPADPHAEVTLESDLNSSPSIWAILDEHDEVIGHTTAKVVALVSQYNYHVHPDTDPLYVAPV